MGNTIICYQYSMSAKSYIVLTILLLGLALSVSASATKKATKKPAHAKKGKAKTPAKPKAPATPKLPAKCPDPCKFHCPKIKCKKCPKGYKVVKKTQKVKGHT